MYVIFLHGFHNAEVYNNRVNMKSASVGEIMTKQCRYNMVLSS